MKVYEILEGEHKISIGCLLYFEKENSYIIELQDNLDEWTAPLLFANKVKKGKYTMDRELSRLWVKQRVIPSDRQNIDSVLANAGMKCYDEMALLAKSGGRCSQDEMYIQKRNNLPAFVKERLEHTLVECIPTQNSSLLCFFTDKTARKVDLLQMANQPEVTKILSNPKVFLSGHIAAGGYCVTFNDSLDLEAEFLYREGNPLQLSLDDFVAFSQRNVVDSSECCEILKCTRQNLVNYLEKDLLTPIKKDTKGNLYTKGNIYRSELQTLI